MVLVFYRVLVLVLRNIVCGGAVSAAAYVRQKRVETMTSFFNFQYCTCTQIMLSTYHFDFTRVVKKAEAI